MKFSCFRKTLAATAAAMIALPAVFAQDTKNVAQVEYRELPSDYEKLPQTEAAKWNFNFRPYGAESSDFLWSDPILIRNAAAGAATKEGNLVTGMYVACNAYGFDILCFGVEKSSENSLKKGGNFEGTFYECFIIPGDSDKQFICNYQPFGCNTTYPYVSAYQISWMKQDRNVRLIFDEMKFDAHPTKNGNVMRISVPWTRFWDTLPVFRTKRDNFWRLSIIRWCSTGGETWGGVVHAQSKCGYIRMPDFTPEQETAILKATISKLWSQYQEAKDAASVNPGRVGNTMNAYRKSIAHLPHSWMNMNEDPVFKTNCLIPFIKERDAIGEGILKFDTMTLAEQKEFYLKNAPRLANFQYDLDDLYAQYLKDQLMKD